MYDILYTLFSSIDKEIKYEWDENKNLANIKKHGVSFELAAECYLDRNAIESYDNDHSDKEDRWILIGKARERLITVVYTNRQNAIRIVSARKSTEKERKIYYGENS